MNGKFFSDFVEKYFFGLSFSLNKIIKSNLFFGANPKVFYFTSINQELFWFLLRTFGRPLKFSLIVSFFLNDEITKMVFPDFTLPDRFSESLWYFMDFLCGGSFEMIGLIKAEDTFVIGFEVPGSVEIGLSKVHDVHGLGG